MTAIDLAEKFFAAVARGDVEGAKACCAGSFRGSQNGGPAMDREGLMEFSAAVKAIVPDFRYEETVRSATDTGFVEEHRVRGILPDGGQLDLMVCVVGEVEEGRITVLREYVDTAAAAGLLKALGAG
ncbi:nuclear transport factor 2 family protein [Erythrobacter sp. HA6-11]